MPKIGPVKLKIQLLCGEIVAMGPGKADLLEAIDRTGSISSAGRELGMSYRRAWVLANELNRCWQDRLIETHAGGGPQSGARLTPFGRRVLDAYRALEDVLATTTDGAPLETLRSLIRAEPMPAADAA